MPFVLRVGHVRAMTEPRAPPLAVLIDADNASARIASELFEEIAKIGEASVRRLAARIREHGTDVYGFGEQKTPESFKQACRRFIYTENLVPQAPAFTDPSRPDASPPSAARPVGDAIPLIRTAISQLDADDGWVSLGAVGQRLAIIATDFDPRSFGHAKLSALVTRTGQFGLRHSQAGPMQVRARAT